MSTMKLGSKRVCVGGCMPRSIIIGHKTELSKNGYEILRAGNFSC